MNTNAISIENLCKTYDGLLALSHLSLDVPPGIIFGFLGANGSGKTTTICLLLGLLEPSDGQARVLGFDTRTQSDHVRARTGALLEHSGIYEQMTAADNLAFYGRVCRMPVVELHARIEELLKHMGLWERRDDRAGNWSRGMKQKLALARTLLHRPQLVILDEPTAGLDVGSAVSIREDLESLVHREMVTIFLTSHNMTDVEKLCSQVGVIRQGKLVAQGSPDDLRRQMGESRVEITGRGFDDQVLQILQAHPNVRSLASNNGHLVVDLHQDSDSTALISILVEGGAQIDEIQRNRNSLEEVFLTLTGGNDEI